ncbi:hypothetical protein [Vibrio tasmaniensis]|uniref:hypothetical protein n=1 Tax=Vibrio tasmaniensis TaxID=212663 RepID=UPI00107F7D33|nr:hypothetical protein [Vibrio tasmaniensis]
MLWPVLLPPQFSLYCLDDVHKGFYRLMFAANTFNDCFPVNFLDVLNGSGETKKRFQAVFTAYQGLDNDPKQEFEDVFDNQVRCIQFFGNTASQVLFPTENIADIWELAKKLGGYLYSTTLDLACFKNITINPADDMRSHFERFKHDNGDVCCFCGTEEMMEERNVEPDEGAISEDEKQWRASYDHYLPKKHYPFLAVDFNNLVPCCQKCNEKAKGELDVLHCDGVRSLAFNPYTDHLPVSLEATYESINGTFAMLVDIEGTADQLAEKADTWNRTFAVLPRINHRLKKFNRSWLGPLLNGVNDVAIARTVLNDEVRRCNLDQKIERDAYFKSLCFEAISNKPDGDISSFIETINQSYARRRI